MTSRPHQPDPPTIALTGIRKSYGGVKALSNASLEVRGGEIHALLGENGAGKSTLVKIIAGAVERDAGTILWRGQEAQIGSFADAERLGIHVIYQQLNVLNYLSVAENIALGRERSRLFVVDVEEARRRAVATLARLGVELDVDTPAENLRVGREAGHRDRACAMGRCAAPDNGRAHRILGRRRGRAAL